MGAPTYPTLRDATQAAFLEILERNRIPHDWNRAENFLVLRETRSKILFRAVEEFERLRGSNLAWFGLDELTYTAEESWLRLEGRSGSEGAAVMRISGCGPRRDSIGCTRDSWRIRWRGTRLVQASPFENRFLLEKIPDYYVRLKSSYDARFYQQEVLGEYISLHSGRVYYGVYRKGNVGAGGGGSGPAGRRGRRI